MSDLVRVASLTDLPPGKAMTVDAKGASLALYNVGGRVYATANTCPHRGGPLGEGDLQGDVVTCPWHRFQFEVTSGACRTNPALSVACHRVEVKGQDILVQL
jgi:nitrite reductase (NADH) small subunit